jgi:excisionase family DNA binding protein
MDELLKDQMTFSVKEVASILHISRGMAYQLARREDFPKMRFGKRIIIPKENFMEWMKRQTKGENDEN